MPGTSRRRYQKLAKAAVVFLALKVPHATFCHVPLKPRPHVRTGFSSGVQVPATRWRVRVDFVEKVACRDDSLLIQFSQRIGG